MIARRFEAADQPHIGQVDAEVRVRSDHRRAGGGARAGHHDGVGAGATVAFDDVLQQPRGFVGAHADRTRDVVAHEPRPRVGPARRGAHAQQVEPDQPVHVDGA